ncbi:response regulator [Nitrincola tapanii]|uniref:Response regulator n=1 Tax=Nitrincola tapanii TaxID=1708751 RepID=A0A5A9VYW3_9GAMM|nr:response regulator [Nitrincola tapanii]KAA0873583.1 response regulator [Nitrincola tapanii]
MNRLSLICVEDDEDIGMILHYALVQLAGFQVELFTSAEAALLHLERYPPDLFLLDVMLPGMSGVEFLTELRKQPRFAHTPAIFLTAKTHFLSKEAAQALLLSGVITKPFNPLTLGDEILSLMQSTSADAGDVSE